MYKEVEYVYNGILLNRNNGILLNHNNGILLNHNNGILLNHKMNELMLFAPTWMDLEIIILCDISQRKTNIV